MRSQLQTECLSPSQKVMFVIQNYSTQFMTLTNACVFTKILYLIYRRKTICKCQASISTLNYIPYNSTLNGTSSEIAINA